MWIDQTSPSRSNARQSATPSVCARTQPASRVRFTKPRFNSEFRPHADDAGALHVVHGVANHARVELPAGWLSLTLTGGAVIASSGGNEWSLRERAVLVWNDELVVRAGRGGSWLMLCGSVDAWRSAAASGCCVDQLVPEETEAPRDLARLLIRVVRCLRSDGRLGQPPLAEAIHTLWDAQGHMRSMMDRCVGRTQQHRVRMMTRLLRLRHLLRTHRGHAFDMDEMCRMTNYSPWHLARVFRAVFQESPIQYATRQRLEYARELVQRSSMSFGDVAAASGFECQSAFNRAFRSFYGTTPSAARSSGECIPTKAPRIGHRPVA